MKVLERIVGLIAVMATIVVLLITSFEIAAYSDFSWYEKEYLKYEVLSDLEMEIEDVMYVTEEMMAYLRDNRGDLVVDTIVNGEEREFFNEREKLHMIDVKGLFMGGLALRRNALLVLAGAVVVLAVMKVNWKQLLPWSITWGIGGFLGILLIGGGLMATDFHKYFFLFHEIFFDNDLWLLDPKTDLMIRMLPEGFFFDMVVRIGIIFFVSLLALLIGAVFMKKRKNKKI